MSQRPLTRSELTAKLQYEQSRYEALRMERDGAAQGGKDMRAKLDELKERLAAAETENNRMRGYLDRVMEDDHVREELIKTGEPEGEQQLVPKRKHRVQPAVYSDPSQDFAAMGASGYAPQSREKRRHWITY